MTSPLRPSNWLVRILSIGGQVSLAMEQVSSLTQDRFESLNNFRSLSNLTEASGIPNSMEKNSGRRWKHLWRGSIERLDRKPLPLTEILYSSPVAEGRCSGLVFQSRHRYQPHYRALSHRYIHQGRPGGQSYHNSSRLTRNQSGSPCRNNILQGDSQYFQGPLDQHPE